MKSIPSEENIPIANIKQGDPPVHTVEGHEKCAYYPGFKPACTHGKIAEGAFYSEDYVRQLRVTLQKLVAELEEGVIFLSEARIAELGDLTR